MERFAVTIAWALGAFPVLLSLSGLRCALHTETLGEGLLSAMGACGLVTLVWGIYGVTFLVTGEIGAGILVGGLAWVVVVGSAANMHRLAAEAQGAAG